VRAVVFTGSGTTSFVAGADVRQLLEDVHSLDEALPLPNNAHLAFRKIEAMGKPASPPSTAWRSAAAWSSRWPVTTGSPSQRRVFGQPEMRLNLLPGYGGTQRLPRLLGDRAGSQPLVTALEIILGGRTSRPTTRTGSAWWMSSWPAATTWSRAPARWLVRSYKSPHRRVDVPFGAASNAEPRASSPGGSGRCRSRCLRWRRSTATAGSGTHRRPHAPPRIVDALRTGWRDGLEAGLAREARLFAEAVVDPDGGKAGIRAFFDKQSAPLPTRRRVPFRDRTGRI
jgi:acrylyl-CoA reductase (NADPH)/3-hydroxypropionyl-CoA dehydratase/3-hydroxypropionyl-CoA synthetase